MPTPAEQTEVVYPLVVRPRTGDDGERFEFVHLDLPGNPFPIVGSREGRPEINAKAAVSADALSRCDAPPLGEILALSAEYCQHEIGHARTLRQAFERIKSDKAYLELVVTISNQGHARAHVSCYADAVLGRASRVVKMLRVEQAPPRGNPPLPAVIRDTARRLAEWVQGLAQELQPYENDIENIPIPPSEAIEVHFVSDAIVSGEVSNAVRAMLTGYTDCTLTLWQYIPRRFVLLPWKARFARRLQTRQRVAALG